MSASGGGRRRCVLVHGFGPFLDVTDNPAARLALAVDGARAGAWDVVGEVMPVSYRRAPAQSVDRARALGASLVIGVGVARRREDVCVEAWAGPEVSPCHPDVDGVRLSRLDDGPVEAVAASGPVGEMATALGGVVSADAGRYVCNAWLYRTVRALGEEIPVLFLHVPPVGLQPQRLLAALANLQESPDGRR